jgi:hypothetical protein
MAKLWECFLLWHRMWHHYIGRDHWHNYFLQCRKALQSSAQCLFLRCLCLVQYVAPLCLQWPLTQIYPLGYTKGTGQCSVYLSLMSMYCTACGTIVFAVATGTTISFGLYKCYSPVLCVSFIDVYVWYSMQRHCVCSGYWHNNILQAGQMVQVSAQSIFLWCLRLVQYVAPLCLQWPVATDTTIYFGLDKRYRPVLSLSFFDVYVLYSMWHHCVCSGHWHNYILWAGQMVWDSAQSIFLRCLCLVQHVV